MDPVNIHTQITDINQAQAIFQPLFDLIGYTREDIHFMKQEVALRAGRFKKRSYLVFEIESINALFVPSQNCIQFLNNIFSDIVLYQQQGCLTKFDFFVAHSKYCKTLLFDQAILEVVNNMLVDKSNLKEIRFMRGGGQGVTTTTIKQAMTAKTGYKMAHQFINIQTGPAVKLQKSPSLSSRAASQYSTSVSSHQCSTFQYNLNGIMVNEKGQVFDVQEFARGCIRVMENLILFTNNKAIRAMQLETNPMVQEKQLRLLDHRPLIQQLWQETIDFALQSPKCKALRDYFTQEQMSILFNSNKQQIDNTFNHYVINSTINLIQPHPVRALLDHMTLLQACPCFDLAKYNTLQYVNNLLHTCYYIGKNFLTEDHSMTNNEGAICFSGVPGGGKTHIQQVLGIFMNAFTLDDSGKGIGEFQNYDIVSKSMIIVEEVELKKLTSNEWKQTGDLIIGRKCKVKNQPDVYVTKYCPVTITTNDNVFNSIISKAPTQQIFNAVLRRWVFIRYFETWAKGHKEIMNQGQYTVAPEFVQLYNPKDLDQQLMNTIIACALMFNDHHFVCVSYIFPYYSHCLTKFSQTFFGQVFMRNILYVRTLVTKLRLTSKDTDFACFKAQKEVAAKLEELQLTEMRSLLSSADVTCVEVAILDEQSPWYFRCLKLLLFQSVQKAIAVRSDSILDLCLDNLQNKGSILYSHLVKYIRMERLICKEPSIQSLQDDVEMEMWCGGIPSNMDIENPEFRAARQPFEKHAIDNYGDEELLEEMSDFSITDFYLKEAPHNNYNLNNQL